MYGREKWTIRKAMEERMESCKIWFLRRMLNISWIAKIKNEGGLKKAG